MIINININIGQCGLQRKLATGAPRNDRADGTVEGVEGGCFLDLYKALAPAEGVVQHYYFQKKQIVKI